MRPQASLAGASCLRTRAFPKIGIVGSSTRRVNGFATFNPA
jgi:hypothetical protein